MAAEAEKKKKIIVETLTRDETACDPVEPLRRSSVRSDLWCKRDDEVFRRKRGRASRGRGLPRKR